MNIPRRGTSRSASGRRGSRRPAACRPWPRRRRTASPRHDRRPVRRPPRPALHGRLRDARSAADADDVVQETWLRWADADRTAVRDPRAYLVRVVTRQALNRLRTVARRREDYVGEWLPEPLLTSRTSPRTSSSRRASRWRCSPCSRRWGRPSAPSSCCTRCSTCPTTRSPRPWASRRRRSGRSPTGRASTWPPGARGWRSAAPSSSGSWTASWPPSPRGTSRASWTSWPPTSWWSPTAAVWRPRRGVRSRAGRGWPTRCPASDFVPGRRITTPLINGAVAARIDPGGEFDTAITFVVEDGRISRVYAIRNPQKLGRLDEVADLRR